MGLPCGPQEVQGAIHPNQAHRHWYYNPQQNLGTITMVLGPYPFNPQPTRTRGRPPGSTTTRCNPSQFQRVESTLGTMITCSQARGESRRN